jgi:alpha-beta hydrolase superfamily lysophospholipase
VESQDLVSVDGMRLDAVLHPAGGAVGLGAVVLAHGITVDMDEGGMFVRLADRLAGAGFAVLRFSFRGHGRSGGTPRGVTVAGEMLDLQAAVDLVGRDHPGPLSVVAASFGAVSTALSLPFLEDRLRGLVLWNPILDPWHTFVEPELPWGVENFGPAQQERLRRDGFLLVDGEFELGRVLFEELRTYRAGDYFVDSGVPALVVHGDRDSYVSYDVAKAACASRPRCELHTVEGSDHGFDSRDREDEAIGVTVEWLTQLHSPEE